MPNVTVNFSSLLYNERISVLELGSGLSLTPGTKMLNYIFNLTMKHNLILKALAVLNKHHVLITLLYALNMLTYVHSVVFLEARQLAP